jgi:hypothetical protein
VPKAQGVFAFAEEPEQPGQVGPVEAEARLLPESSTLLCDHPPQPELLGARVLHNHYGYGTLANVWEGEASPRVTVHFDRGGERLFNASEVRLRVLGGIEQIQDVVLVKFGDGQWHKLQAIVLAVQRRLTAAAMEDVWSALEDLTDEPPYRTEAEASRENDTDYYRFIPVPPDIEEIEPTVAARFKREAFPVLKRLEQVASLQGEKLFHEVRGGRLKKLSEELQRHLGRLLYREWRD